MLVCVIMLCDNAVLLVCIVNCGRAPAVLVSQNMLYTCVPQPAVMPSTPACLQCAGFDRGVVCVDPPRLACVAVVAPT